MATTTFSGPVVSTAGFTGDITGNITGNVNATTVSAGASGTAGTVSVFPTTASKGKLTVTASDATGNTTTNLNVAAQAAARTITIPDPGTSSSSVLLADGAQTINGATTFAANPVLGTGTRVDLASTTATLSSNAATITQYAAVITTESLTTAGAASQALVITKVGVAAGDLAFVMRAGGTNTVQGYTLSAVCTTDTVTITVYNTTAATALNGTLILNLVIFKA